MPSKLYVTTFFFFWRVCVSVLYQPLLRMKCVCSSLSLLLQHLGASWRSVKVQLIIAESRGTSCKTWLSAMKRVNGLAKHQGRLKKIQKSVNSPRKCHCVCLSLYPCRCQTCRHLLTECVCSILLAPRVRVCVFKFECCKSTQLKTSNVLCSLFLKSRAIQSN